MTESLVAILTKICNKTKDEKPRLVFISSAGTKHFMFGGDLLMMQNAIHKSKKEKSLTDTLLYKTFFVRWHAVESAVADLLQSENLSAIAFWKGKVIGGGVGLTHWCHFKIATESASYAVPETNIPMATYQANLCFLPTFSWDNLPRALYIALTVPDITGKDIVRHGIATHFV